jgi:hypothetical protein
MNGYLRCGLLHLCAGHLQLDEAAQGRLCMHRDDSNMKKNS